MPAANESNGIALSDVFTLPDELFKFTDTRGRAYTLDLLDCHEKQNDISAEASKHLAEHPEDHFFFLRQWEAWLKTQGIPPEGAPATEKLRLGELDRLWHEARMRFAAKKKEQNDEYVAMQKSLSSTGSTPGE
mgnify:CR=1 FL=1